ncbi:hypothetical protein HHL22_18290 [Hymenobacter sp. RP-2-7]|uniref:Linalool dehydratase/isomerase domain-containing protein n=1 Tax=Hymenobacter polaris TaxID=2682546 RepID=A0A7Y0AGY7_9BACT|nr:hypothetical protein [Hymenobacter polaris]NML67158.1 hypothetical protein [Hymenobacter polaris]
MAQKNLLRRLRWGRLLLLAAALAWLAASWPTYRPPTAAELRPRLNYLGRVIDEGAAPGTALGQLTATNAEWGLFTLAFSTYGLANEAARQPALRPEAARIIGQAIGVTLTAPVRQPFLAGPADSCLGYALPQSVLYLGHLNLMLGCHRRLDPASPYARLHDSLSARLAWRLGQDPAGNLPSYPNLRWLPDNAVALASLALHSRLTGSPYAAVGQRWVARARRQWLDADTGLLASMVDAVGRPSEEPRGSHLGWSIWFLAQVDSAFARQQYALYQQHHSTNLGALRLYREFAHGYAIGAGNVDSGPLVLGYGIPATTFAFADAVALGDYRNAQRLRRVISLGSREIREGNELRYGVRFIKLDVNPLSEALLLWADVPGAGRR